MFQPVLLSDGSIRPEDRSGSGAGEPATGWIAVTPSDTANLPVWPRGLYIGGTGGLRVLSARGEDVSFAAAAVGYHAIRPVRVYATGTTATGIIALY